MNVDVVGAGFSGLATAYYLNKLGAKVRVFETKSAPGGLLNTIRTPYGLVETAANAFLNSSLVEELFSDLGVLLLPSKKESRARYIYRGGPKRWPLSMVGSARFASALPLVLARADKIKPKPFESVRHWSDRVLGSEATEFLVGPALQGIYAGDVNHMSATLIFKRMFEAREQLPKPKVKGSVSAPEGMGQVVFRMKELLEERGVSFRFGEQRLVHDVDRPTVFCGSAHAAADWLRTDALETSVRLSQVDLTPVTTITCFFEPSSSDLKGFGVLFPRGEGVSALGVLFNNHIFEGRSSVRSETWIYRGADATVDRVLHDRRALVTTRPVLLHHVVTAWSEAIPHYTVELEKILSEPLELPPQVYLMGNYLGSIGLSRMLERAKVLAESIRKEKAGT